MQDEVISLFVTTLFKRRLDGMMEHNQALAALVAGMEAKTANAAAGSSTHGGFQTREDFLSSEHSLAGHPAMLALKQHIADAINTYSGILIRQECARMPSHVGYRIWGWAVSLKAGNWQGHHVHSGADISGVYYVSAPPVTLDPAGDEGKITFYDPRPRANMSQLLTQITVRRETPAPGDLVLFPSWLEHSVPPFQGGGARVCIAFNVKLEMT